MASKYARCSSTTGMVSLGDLWGGDVDSRSLDISADGTVIVGYGTSLIGREACLWDADRNIVTMHDLLTATYGLDLIGWTLMETTGISDDGQVFVGYGINPAGYGEAWIAVIPEPASLTLLFVAAAGLLTRRRQTRHV